MSHALIDQIRFSKAFSIATTELFVYLVNLILHLIDGSMTKIIFAAINNLQQIVGKHKKYFFLNIIYGKWYQFDFWNNFEVFCI